MKPMRLDIAFVVSRNTARPAPASGPGERPEPCALCNRGFELVSPFRGPDEWVVLHAPNCPNLNASGAT